MTTLAVSEIFGPTVQGEGPRQGRLAAFLRVGRCDLDCAFCDSAYTWDWTGKVGPPQDPGALQQMAVDEVVRRLVAPDADLVVITGGEPLVQRQAVREVAESLVGLGKTVEIETNGRHPPMHGLDDLADNRLLANVHYNVSPKLANSGVERSRRIRPDVLVRFLPVPSVFKFVVAEPGDFDELDALVAETGMAPGRVWIQPEARDPATLARGMAALADLAVARGYNLSGRLHLLAWGDERGH